jgi:hypothetical protein
MADETIDDTPSDLRSRDTLERSLEARVDALERQIAVDERISALEERIGTEPAVSVNGFLAAGFGTFGFVVGLLTGLTQSEIVQPLIAALFALIGGSLVAFIHKLNSLQQRRAGIALTLVAIGLTVGVLSGIVIREHRLLGGTAVAAQEAGSASSEISGGVFGYLRSEQNRQCNEVDEARSRNMLSTEKAYEAMYSACLMEQSAPR